MATIDFRGWRLESEAHGWALGRPETRLNKKKELEIYLVSPSYHASLEYALKHLLELEMRESDATCATDLMMLMRQVKVDIERLLREPHDA